MFDLAPHDADLLSKQKNFDSINEEDIEIEELCDKERYMDLNKQLKSEALYQGMFIYRNISDLVLSFLNTF